ncbi:ketopantoate hydroxymethyltransferase-domain-containing protein [Chytriomyces cf. hyalinus JEL632]|nr:ketopantoate hydroxymethyltransferase-domain-containing protein [Chytriomyces cf. hyalinus JEL632]
MHPSPRFPTTPSSISVTTWRALRHYSSPPPSSPAAVSADPAGLQRKKVTVKTIQKLYKTRSPITMMTAHDYPSGVFCEKGGMEVCLVGDSLAMVALGYDSTTRITLEEMMHHSRAVARGSKSAFLIGDLPFGTYEKSAEHAIDNAIRFIREGHVEAVKLEGGVEIAGTIKRIVDVGIPVLGHVGLTPQRASSLGGFRAQGTSLLKAKALLADATALQEAGCFAMVLESVPSAVAEFITKRLSIPTIGIGAGPHCSGQVLVQMDMLGIYDKFTPKFCKLYERLDPLIVNAMKEYGAEVKQGTFPDSKLHTYAMEKGEEEKFLNWVKEEYGE